MVLAEMKCLTGGGTDVAIEAPGAQHTFESALRSFRPGGTLQPRRLFRQTAYALRRFFPVKESRSG